MDTTLRNTHYPEEHQIVLGTDLRLLCYFTEELFIFKGRLRHFKVVGILIINVYSKPACYALLKNGSVQDMSKVKGSVLPYLFI